MKDLHVMFTMDCEAACGLAAEGGPKDWDFCRKSISGFCELLLKHGFKATLFIVPYTAEKASGTLLELEKQGVELGLHFHPQDYGYEDYLGAYTGERQRDMLSEAVERWSGALGKRPVSFRGGNMSANDYTYPVIYSLGFRQGSLCLPERNFTRVKANWKGAPLFPHFTNEANRLLEGSMDFLEIPVTVDWESIMWGGLTPLELRIEMVDARAHGFTARKSLDRQLREKAALPALVSLTHNIFDYSDDTEFRTQVLKGVIQEIRNCCEMNGLGLKGPSLAEFHRLFTGKQEG